MSYDPLSYDKEAYLEQADAFENMQFDDAQEELTEFSNDAEDIAFDLAYLRYHYAKKEKEVERLRKDAERQKRLRRKATQKTRRKHNELKRLRDENAGLLAAADSLAADNYTLQEAAGRGEGQPNG